MVMLPPKDSRRARGWITDSEPMVTGFVPVRTASSAIVTEEEKATGGLGPDEACGGTVDVRFVAVAEADIVLTVFPNLVQL